MEQQKEFKANEVGAIVRLKSGSPVMTVTKVIDNDKVMCAWFVDGENREAIFPFLALKEGILMVSTNEDISKSQYSYSL